MTSHSNLQQIEEKISLLTAQGAKYLYNKNACQADKDKAYWQKYIDNNEETIRELQELANFRRKSNYYDIPINDLYKSEWNQAVYGGGTKAQLFPGDVIGVELEYEGEHLHINPVEFWKTNVEHSLREYKGHLPVEYVLIKPLPRDKLTSALKYLEAKMKAAGSNPVSSPRTSTHVHLNAQGMTWKQIITWVCTYALVEDILVEYSGKERIGNLFCLRTRDTHHFITCLESAIKNEQYNLVTDHQLRYTSMNLASIQKFGSVEFRSMRSPISFDDLNKWIDVLQAIKVASLSWKNPREVVEFFEKHGPSATLKRIFPVPWMYDLFDHPKLKEIMWEAIREVKDVAFASDWLPKTQQVETTKKEDKAEIGAGYQPGGYISVDDLDWV